VRRNLLSDEGQQFAVLILLGYSSWQAPPRVKERPSFCRPVSLLFHFSGASARAFLALLSRYFGLAMSWDREQHRRASVEADGEARGVNERAQLRRAAFFKIARFCVRPQNLAPNF
jgi:hypothetical protein